MVFLNNLCEIGIALDFQWYRSWVVTWTAVGTAAMLKFYKRVSQNYIMVITAGTIVMFFVPLIDIWLRSGMNGPVTMLAFRTLFQPLLCAAVLWTSIVVFLSWNNKRKNGSVSGIRNNTIDVSSSTRDKLSPEASARLPTNSKRSSSASTASSASSTRSSSESVKSSTASLASAALNGGK